MLSTIKYSARCVLGMEIFYVLCIAYGLVLLDKAKELHRALFELVPGFVWGNPLSIRYGVGSLVYGSAGMDRGLVFRVDA